MNSKTNFLILTLMLVMLTLCEARGGGRRGGGSGGSFGGLFGNWRKSKKQSSSGVSSRRITSSVPPSPPQRESFLKSNNFYNNNSNSPLSPKVGSYYPNTGILPANQINSVNDYFKTRLTMTGIVQPDYRHNFLRDDEFLNDMLIMLRNIFQQAVEPLTTVSTTTTASETLSTTETQNTESTDLSQFSITETSMSSPYDTICMPMSVPENNEEDEQRQVEKIICYPAPAPPSSQINLESKPIEISGDIIEA